MGALIALASRVIAPLGRALGVGASRRVAGPLAVIAGGTVAGQAIGDVLFDGDGGGGAPPRRRRRKALSETDIRTALTIASAISKKAAENFILMRVRSG